MTLLADNQETPVIDDTKNYLEEIMGEGKKYKDPEALAKKAVHADIHIATLERRLDEAREEYKKLYEESKTVPKLQELIAKLSNDQQVENKPITNVENNTDLMDATKLDSYFDTKFQKMEQTRRQDENYNLVERTVQETLGENYKSILNQRAKSMGLTTEEVTAMARGNPNLFFKTFDINKQPTGERFQTPPASALRNNSFEPKSQKRTLKYYQEMRKTNPLAYLDPKIAVQMDKDALEQGEAFFDV